MGAILRRHTDGVPGGPGYLTELSYDQTNDFWYTNIGSKVIGTVNWSKLRGEVRLERMVLTVNGNSENLSSGTKGYVGFFTFGVLILSQGQPTFKTYLPPGTLKNFRFNCMVTGADAAQSIFIYKNNVATTLGGTFTALNALYGPEQSDLNPAHAVTVVAGDYVQVVVGISSRATTKFYANVEFYT